MSTHVQKRKRVWPKVLGIVLLVFLLIAAGIAFWQRDNIKAFYVSRTNTSDQIAEQTAKTQQDLTDKLKEDYGVSIRELTEEEQAKIASGELTTDEIAALLLSDSVSSVSGGAISSSSASGNNNAAGSGVTSSSGSNTPEANTQGGSVSDSGQSSPAATIISEGAARMYALKATLNSSLAGIVQEAKDEFVALPEAERTASAKQSIVTRKLSDAASLESECDAQVDQILSDVKNQLTAIGSETSAVDVLRTAYDNEKVSTKAYYLSQLG